MRHDPLLRGKWRFARKTKGTGGEIVTRLDTKFPSLKTSLVTPGGDSNHRRETSHASHTETIFSS